jgi:hypothetical protein
VKTVTDQTKDQLLFWARAGLYTEGEGCLPASAYRRLVDTDQHTGYMITVLGEDERGTRSVRGDIVFRVESEKSI